MAISSEFRLYQAAVELQYQRGIVYLDRCGSLMLKLQEQLGEPFKAGELAGMDYGELNSIAERIAVRYGRLSMNLTHSWPTPPTPVRLEQLAPVAWDVVADTLNVGKWVTRCGVRFWLTWRVDSIEEASERIRNAELFFPAEAWGKLFGKMLPHGWTIALTEPHASIRMSIDFGSTNVQGALPADLVDIVPKYSIVLDLDHYRPDRAGAPPLSIGKSELKEFIRTTWQRTKVVGTTVGKLLGA